jgi:hypothetical protein
MSRLIAGALLLVALTGCGPHLTRALWRSDLPRHQPARALAATGKVLVTPVTVVIDGAGAVCEGVATEPEFWDAVAHVTFGVLEGCIRVASR